MNEIEEALQELQRLSGQVTSQIIKDLIADHAPIRAKMIKQYDRYKANSKGVPILTREMPDSLKVNNKLNNAFDVDVIDTRNGYFAGVPINYNLDKEHYLVSEDPITKKKTYNDTAYNKDLDVINQFTLINSIDDQDSETDRKRSICGLGARLCYIDREGLERVMVVDPWECIFIYDRSINEPQYTMRYYPMTVNGEEYTRVEWYDDSQITYYIEDGNGEYSLDQSEQINPQPHMFDYNPLIAFVNNDEMMGDCERVYALIDGYDNAISDVSSEITQFRLAYMYMKGVEPSAETIELAKQTGAFGVGETGEVGFITKDMNDTVVENHLNRVEENIYRFAKSVNFNDEAFGGTISGIAMKFKLFGLETKCIVAERKFTSALRQMFKILASAWNRKGLQIDYTKIWFQFKRNVFYDPLAEAQSTMALKGLVSEETRLGLLSFVDDVEWEREAMEQDAQGSINLEDDEDEE